MAELDIPQPVEAYIYYDNTVLLNEATKEGASWIRSCSLTVVTGMLI